MYTTLLSNHAQHEHFKTCFAASKVSTGKGGNFAIR